MKEMTTSGCTVPYIPENSNICKKESDRDLAFQTHYDRITNQVITGVGMVARSNTF